MNDVSRYVLDLWRVSQRAFERRELMSTIITSLVALIVAYLTALQIKIAVPHGELWEWVVGLWIIFQFIFIAPFRLYQEQRRKLDEYDEEARPKVSVSAPIETVEPKGATGKDVASGEFRLRVNNCSTTLIKNCYVKQASLLNKNGHESDILGIHFKLNTDQPVIIQSYEHQQSFDLPPYGHEIVSICGTNRTIDNSQQTVIMLYAIQGVGGQGIRNAIPRSFFPHTLTVQVCADNLARPVEIKYRLFFKDDGAFKMEKVHT